MKKTILLFTILVSFALTGLAQSGRLEFRKIKSQKTKYVQEGKKIKVTSEGKTFKGRFGIISDESILVESDTLYLKEIQNIRTKSLGNSLGGGLLFISGTYLTAGMLYGIALSLSEGAGVAVLGTLFFGTLGVATAGIAAGGMIIMINGKAHKAKKWEYRIASN